MFSALLWFHTYMNCMTFDTNNGSQFIIQLNTNVSNWRVFSVAINTVSNSFKEIVSIVITLLRNKRHCGSLLLWDLSTSINLSAVSVLTLHIIIFFFVLLAPETPCPTWNCCWHILRFQINQQYNQQGESPSISQHYCWFIKSTWRSELYKVFICTT